jgi:hypothetical protein
LSTLNNLNASLRFKVVRNIISSTLYFMIFSTVLSRVFTFRGNQTIYSRVQVHVQSIPTTNPFCLLYKRRGLDWYILHLANDNNVRQFGNGSSTFFWDDYCLGNKLKDLNLERLPDPISGNNFLILLLIFTPFLFLPF